MTSVHACVDTLCPHRNIVSVLGVGELNVGPTIHTAYMVQVREGTPAVLGCGVQEVLVLGGITAAAPGCSRT